MKATDTFRHPVFKHNCAQAIANKWSALYASGTKIVAEYAPLIGGHAPGGLCGALYAATEACPDRADEIIAEFTKIVGASTCGEIKGTTSTPCTTCVDTADRLLDKYTRH